MHGHVFVMFKSGELPGQSSTRNKYELRHDNALCHGGSSLTNEKDHHYFLNRFVCVGEFFDG